jgi:hypothetical protein
MAKNLKKKWVKKAIIIWKNTKIEIYQSIIDKITLKKIWVNYEKT